MASLWQRACIALARHDGLKHFIQNRRALAGLAQRFVAGAETAAALDTAARLREGGISVSLFHLGEYVADQNRIAANIQATQELIDASAGRVGELHVSIDPSAVGYAVSHELGQANALSLGRAVRDAAVPGRKVLMLDMEDRDYVELTLALHDLLRAEGIPVAITVQAYLRRSEADVRRLAGSGASVRIVKGAFAGAAESAHQRREEIDAAYLRMAETLLEPRSRSAGTFPSFATHDDRMIAALIERIEAGSVPSNGYEFEMLLGVREPLQRRLVAEGHPLRLYAPSGKDWWPYAVRRIGENPANIRFMLTALRRN